MSVKSVLPSYRMTTASKEIEEAILTEVGALF
jgi:hypothetical protein